MTTGARTPEAVEADAPLGFILTAVLRFACVLPEPGLCDLLNFKDRDLVICLPLAAFGRLEFWNQLQADWEFSLLPRRAGCASWRSGLAVSRLYSFS